MVGVVEPEIWNLELLIPPVNPHVDELFGGGAGVAFLDLPDEIDRHAVDAHGDERLDGDLLVAERLEVADVLGRDAVDAHGDELLRRYAAVAQGFEIADELDRSAMDSHGDEILNGNPLVA